MIEAERWFQVYFCVVFSARCVFVTTCLTKLAMRIKRKLMLMAFFAHQNHGARTVRVPSRRPRPDILRVASKADPPD